ncbi:hypothetical protein F5Y11DRAFT_315309 [Daldinia sp. FL1419]|nr:hypothetical protein F5Y11DRAFT_315309 [Daldinia sp. FL1419]
MWICRESRSAMQKSTMVVFDMDQKGAWLNPRRGFRPDVDILCVGIHALLSTSKHRRMPLIKPNIHGSIKEQQSLPDGNEEDDYIHFRRELIYRYLRARRTNRHTGSGTSVDQVFLLYAFPGGRGSSGRTAIQFAGAKPKHCLLDEISDDPLLVIGGDESKWKFAVPDFKFFVLPQGRWPD